MNMEIIDGDKLSNCLFLSNENADGNGWDKQESKETNSLDDEPSNLPYIWTQNQNFEDTTT